jgi:putative membrane-bound dehydrogenase-like protein
LAFKKKTTASSEESGKNNFAANAVDGNLKTRWCANNGQPGSWWQVDLGAPEHVRSLRIHWEALAAAYQYKVEASVDGEKWNTLIDQSENKEVARRNGHEVDAPGTRFLRVTYLGSNTGAWGSFWEFEAYNGGLPELPKSVTENADAGPSATIADVQAPAEFQVTMFGQPPEVNYPVCLTTAPTGEVFVGVDEQGSLGKAPDGGRVLRCLDVDGDGRADKINVFAKMDHPRGLIYDQGSLWVLHPPYLSVYHDDNLDGTADRHETLITGISTEEVNKRGADHTTNGIRMGIDGWIYIAVGDFGFTEARGTDGTVLSRRGGGIVRVRPDASHMEIYCWGLRNILDVSIDPYMNIFTRDNTNDGGGWDIRVTHILQSANYGYPSLYKNFTEEIMPPLANYGGGSGCGTMFLHDTRWPKPYGDALYTADWGRNEVYIHNLPTAGATFEPHQDMFVKIPRPTDLDVDGSGRMYISSWKNGQFNYKGPNVGFVAQLTPVNYLPKPFPNLQLASVEKLVGYLSAESAVYRLHSQRELLRRESNGDTAAALVKLAQNEDAPLHGRVAAIYTLKQLEGAKSNGALLELAKLASVQEFALRALTDRADQLEGVPTEPFIAALKSDDPRVRAQAVISLGRLGDKSAAEALLPHTSRSADDTAPTAEPLWNQPDAGRVIPHLAVKALAALEAEEACLAAIDGPNAAGALWALKYIHTEAAVSGLLRKLSTVRDVSLRREVLTTLIRLYHREGQYKSGWWGTRPDTSGPYYDRNGWEQSERIAAAIKVALTEADPQTAEHIKEQLARHKVQIEGLPSAADLAEQEEEKPIVLPPVDPNNPHQIANQEPAAVTAAAIGYEGDVQRGKLLFSSQSCLACHTYANGQNPKGPHLVDIGKRYKKPELVESILKPSAKIAQGFDTWSFILDSGKIFTGFVVKESADTIMLRQADGVSIEIVQEEIEERVKRENSMMPDGLVKNISPEQLADLVAYLQSLK